MLAWEIPAESTKRQNTIRASASSTSWRSGWNVTLWQNRMDAQVAQADVDGEKVILVKPQTYMNNSGQAVGPLMRWYKLEQADVYVVYDDMDLPVGRLRIRKNGSDGGHNGIKSLFANGCRDFIRFRVGIGGLCRTAMSSTTC